LRPLHSVRPWRKAAATVVVLAVQVEERVVARAQEPAVPERAPVAEPPGVPAAAPDPAHRPGLGAAADRAAPAAAGLNIRSAAARELRARAE
jgi:hypothetical protein